MCNKKPVNESENILSGNQLINRHRKEKQTIYSVGLYTHTHTSLGLLITHKPLVLRSVLKLVLIAKVTFREVSSQPKLYLQSVHTTCFTISVGAKKIPPFIRGWHCLCSCRYVSGGTPRLESGGGVLLDWYATRGAEQPPVPSCPSQEPVTAGSLREPLCQGRRDMGLGRGERGLLKGL